MSQVDISAAIKKKQEATKNIRTHANQTIKELDKAVLNLNKNRKIAQERINADQREIDNLRDRMHSLYNCRKQEGDTLYTGS